MHAATEGASSGPSPETRRKVTRPSSARSILTLTTSFAGSLEAESAVAPVPFGVGGTSSAQR
jgi:hypothetical protein